MADLPLIAYHPIKRIIKQEVPDQPHETNSVEEENWMLQVNQFSLFLKFPVVYNAVNKM